jgi:hypothetical protein
MNDFLHNLRSGKEKRYERGRRPYINPQFRDNDWRNGNEQKKGGYRKNSADEQTAAIKIILENIAKNQERIAIAEERKADAIEHIARALINGDTFKTTSPESFAQTEASLAGSETTGDFHIETAKTHDLNRNETLNIINEMREKGVTYGKIAEHLQSKEIPTFSGKGKWSAQTVNRIYRQNSQP